MRILFLAGVLLLPLQAMTQQPLASLRDHKRVLLVFAPDGQDDRFRTQLARLDGKQMAERDLILIPGLERWGKLDDEMRAAHAPFTADAEQSALRHRFHIDPNTFTVLLLGKDGTEKLRSTTPITLERLTETIDAMPMRRQEMHTSQPR